MAAKKLMVADDSLTIQKIMRLALANEGYEIQSVSDGNDAVQQIMLFKPDVVLIDVSLPGKSAFEVKRAINDYSELSETRFILMSTAYEKIDEQMASQLHFQGRLTKPFDPPHLKQVIADALKGSGVAELEQPQSAPPQGIPLQGDTAPQPQDSKSMGEDLWDTKELGNINSLSNLPPPPLSVEKTNPEIVPPPSPALSVGSEDLDIKELTETTLKLSNLDELQWSVNETARKPELPPMPPSLASGFPPAPPPAAPPPATNAHKIMGDSTLTNLVYNREPALPPHPNMIGDPEPDYNFDDLNALPSLQPSSFEIPVAGPSVGVPAAPPAGPQPGAQSGPQLGSQYGSQYGSDQRTDPLIEFTPQPVFEPMPDQLPPSLPPQLPPMPQQQLPPIPEPLPPFPQSPAPPSIAAPPLAGPPSMPPFPPMDLPPSTAEATVAPVSIEQMEAIIQKEVQQTIENMARRILPEIAEKIIKQEIHRMLSEQP